MSSHHDILVQAIERRQRLRFTYHHRSRWPNPSATASATTATSCYASTSSKAARARRFQVPLIEDLTLLDEHFDAPGPHYKRNDLAMREFIRQL